MSQQVFVPFLLTLFAGISTGIGSTIAFLHIRHTPQHPSDRAQLLRGQYPLNYRDENRS